MWLHYYYGILKKKIKKKTKQIYQRTGKLFNPSSMGEEE